MRLIDADELLDRAICTRNYVEIKSLVERMPTIAPPPNDPPTLEELREMEGEPVWLKVRGDDGHYVMFYGFENNRACFYNEISRNVEEYGKTWLAYRRKPEGGDRVDR